MRLWFCLTVLLTCATLVFASPTTQPTIASADAIARQLGEALAAGDINTIRDLIGESTVRSLGSQEESDCRRLAELFSGATLVSARASSGLPQRLAADLSDDFAIATLPDPIKRRMTTTDLAAANSTAARWVRHTLKPHPGQFVTVLAFYQPPVVDSSAIGQILFALVKLQPVEDEPMIVQVVYGDPAAGL